MLALCVVAALSGCSGVRAPSVAAESIGPTRPPGPTDSTVILISLDGTTPADLERHPFFAELAARGAAASRLVPVFPTNTFPNHVSLVTGVRPGRHGIVNNRFDDPVRGLYDYDADPTWIEVEPLWSMLDRQGVVSASFHWVGSEGAWRNGHGPRHWRPFAANTPEAEKVGQILAWLDLPRAERPRLVTAWFRGADAAGHRYGPGAPQVDQALAEQVRALASLVSGLEARDRFANTTLLLVSDHGMRAFAARIDLASALRAGATGVRVNGGGGFATGTAGGDPSQIEAAIEIARGLGVEAWRRERAPAALGLDHPRFGDLVFLAPLGRAIGDSGGAVGGAHGYLPELPEMHGIFLAIGRGAAPGVRLGSVQTLQVAPSVLALLGLPIPDWMEAPPIAALLPSVHDAEAAGTFRGP